MDDYTWQRRLRARRTQERRRLSLVFLLAAALIGAVVWYFFFFIRSPEYALEEIQTALTERDGEKFNHYVNAELLSSLGRYIGERGGREHTRMAVGGTSNMLTYPEYNDMEKVKALLNLVETRDRLASIISQKGSVSVTVRIGPETGVPEMEDCSIVTATYSTHSGQQGTIGVIGPTRMHYSRVLSVLGTMGEQLSELFGAGTDEPSDNKQKGSDDIS